jgi:hypothetical protein
MDRVHGFGSWVHDIADQSRPLILIRAARILLKWKGIGDLILTLHLWADGSHHIRPTGAAHRPGAAGQWGAHRSFAPELSGAWWRRVFGAKWCGVDGVLTRGEMRWGTTPRRLAAVVSLLRARVTVSDDFDTLLAPRSSSTPSSWPPLASRLVQWLESMTFSSNLVAARVQRVTSFVG